MQDDEVEYRYENSVDPDWIMKLHFQKNGNSYVYRNENILLIDSTASTINEKEIMVYKYDLKNNPEGTHLITIISREYGWMGYSIDPAGNGMVLNTFGGEKMDNKWMQLMTDKDTGFFRYRH